MAIAFLTINRLRVRDNPSWDGVDFFYSLQTFPSP